MLDAIVYGKIWLYLGKAHLAAIVYGEPVSGSYYWGFAPGN